MEIVAEMKKNCGKRTMVMMSNIYVMRIHRYTLLRHSMFGKMAKNMEIFAFPYYRAYIHFIEIYIIYAL